MRRAAAALSLLVVAGCGGGSDDPGPTPEAPARLKLESPAFHDGAALPKRFSCDGKGVSPPLRWSDVPAKARDLALIVEDRDVPVGAFAHWTMWKLPFQPDGSGRVLEGNVAPEMGQGRNDFGEQGWGPACPPPGDGAHHYVFTLYALDHVAELAQGAPASEVRAAVAASAVAQGQLRATYDR